MTDEPKGLLSADNPYSCRDEIEKWLAWDTAWHRLALEVAVRRKITTYEDAVRHSMQKAAEAAKAAKVPLYGPMDRPPFHPEGAPGREPRLLADVKRLAPTDSYRLPVAPLLTKWSRETDWEVRWSLKLLSAIQKSKSATRLAFLRSAPT